MKRISGEAKTIRQLLKDEKYAIDYYQREYKWQTKHVVELLHDLEEKFFECYVESHDRCEVEHYGHYFLGSIIISRRDGRKYVIDGQQRLTTLTLLLIHLHRLQLDLAEGRSEVGDMIFSEKFGRRSFNLEVPERADCMNALFNGLPFDDNGSPESVRNIVARFGDIEEHFEEMDLVGPVLPFFVDWLKENVHLVEIAADSDDDAYTIFETMNDRGLSLTPTDMLKGYLLANIANPDERTRASETWRSRVNALAALGKDEDADSIKAWLRSQHADSIRERKKGARPQDFDRIGTEFHRWVRDKEETIGLKASADYVRFIERDFAFYTRWYRQLRAASQVPTEGLAGVYHVAQHDFTLQYTVLLAPLVPSEAEELSLRKIRVASAYLDILVASRIWNFRAIDYSTMQYAMFLVMRDIRGATSAEMARILADKLDTDASPFADEPFFRMHGQNRRQIRKLLARMTDYVETQSGMPSRLAEYASRQGRNGFEVEHIWANHPGRHVDEFASPHDFADFRNRIGGLLLLPKAFNASYGDLPYEDKLEHYFGQNLLARSLHPRCYEHNPGFLGFVSRSGLPFRPLAHFRKADLDARQELYLRLAEQVWSPGRLEQEARA